MQTESSDARSSILKRIGKKKKIKILLSLPTESSDARPKKYRGQKNKIKIFRSIQTEETSNARPSSLKSIGGKKIRLIILLYIQTKSSDGRPSILKKYRGKTKKINILLYIRRIFTLSAGFKVSPPSTRFSKQS